MKKKTAKKATTKKATAKKSTKDTPKKVTRRKRLVKFGTVIEDAYCDLCPVCDEEFNSRFGQCVCEHCGYISAGCDACPQEVCGAVSCDKCPVAMPHIQYGIFTKKEYDSLPEEYKGLVSHSAGEWFAVLVADRVHHIYSSRKVVGVTTIDMQKWREGDRDLADTPKLLDVWDMYDKYVNGDDE